MPIEIKMPRLSDTMENGTLVKWYVKEGDAVEPDQVIADVETDKATMEMPIYDAGKVAKILVEEGATVDIGEVLAVLAEEGEEVNDVASKFNGSARDGGGQAKSAEETKKKEKEEEAATGEDDQKDQAAARDESRRSDAGDEGDESRAGGRILASPLARRLAEEHDLDLKSIEGSGPGGRIVKRDILPMIEGDGRGAPPAVKPKPPGKPTPTAAERAPAPAPAAEVPAPSVPKESIYKLGQSVKLSNMRQTIARRLVESKREIPHYQVSVNVNADPLLDLRKTLNEQLASQNVKLSVNDFIVRACALSIHQHPIVNARWNEKGNETTLEIGERVNIGMAIALPEERGGGLIVATIFDADRKGLRQISAESKSLAKKAREKGLSIEEMSDSTFTISNMGMFDVDFFTAVINPPNAAILAVGSALEKPVARGGELTVGHEMSLTASFDHRIIDGATGAVFLQTLKTMLENPATLLV